MSVEAAVFDALMGTPEVTAYLGDRLYPDQIPESSEFPCGTFEQANFEGVECFDGPADFDSMDLDFVCYGRSKAEARGLARAIRDALRGYRVTAATVRILGTFFRGESSEVEIPVNAEERGIFAHRLSFSVWHETL